MDSDKGASRRFKERIGRSVSLDHAAEMLGVSRRTIYNRIRQSHLRTIRTANGSQRVLRESLDAWDMHLSGVSQATSGRV